MAKTTKSKWGEKKRKKKDKRGNIFGAMIIDKK